ncbi:putative Ig domain-containing protein [Glycomyces sp. NPDC049804]|uniref:putative Ig domain-containing protein n=1 Tax=Glycomyces sp. NPDC049804 TaxID=3154363 RepID=UPI0034129537
MTQVGHRTRPRLTALTAALAAGIAMVAVPPAAQAETSYDDLLTAHVVEINETVSDAGFVHPGVGLSADDLRNAQAMVRSNQEPWASYFDAMTQVTPWAAPGYTVDNMVRGKPDVPVTDTFTQGGMRSRLTRDSFGVLTQALMWTMTGDEVYRKGAIMGLRTWSNMKADGYAYFPDAHIHTGKPLSQFLMAAEIIRATEPVADDTPGAHDGYNVEWSAEDDAKLLGNLAEPIVNVFNFSNEKWMNQHNFGLYGRIATAIYADDAEGYAKGVEWFTVNSTFDNYTSGSMAAQFPAIAADDPLNPYGYDFVQLREMGRDQAHAECNIDNFAALARFLDVQGTKVDPVAGTVSTADDAVTAYGFLGNRLLKGADAFAGFMMGAWTPYVDERDTGGAISQAYRGRIFNALSELYYQYTYVEGVDVEAEAPWLAELHARMDGPLYQYGTGTANFWAPGDKSIEYWVAFPQEITGTEPRPAADTALTFGNYGLALDDGTAITTEDGHAFARATADADGTTSVISRVMFPGNSRMGVLVRTDGPATLEVLDKEEPNTANPDETAAKLMASIELPDTHGEWRYVTYPAGGLNTHFFRVKGDGTTVDLDKLIFNAQTALTPPVFEQTRDRYYLWAGNEASFDLSAADTGGSVAYTAAGLPRGASLDAATGTLTWKPDDRQRGVHQVQVVADDGESITARTFELSVARNRPKMIEAAVADGVDAEAVYTTVTREPYEAALAAARDASESGTDAAFRTAFESLLGAIEKLSLLSGRLPDGTLDYTGMVVPQGISTGGLYALADGDNTSSFGDVRLGSVTLDFGTRYRVAVDEFDFRARFSFPMRSEGTNVYGSNDGLAWTLLTERDTANTNDWESIPVVADQRGKEWRYLKLQVDNPGVPIDPAYPGLWSIGEFRIGGDRVEVPGTIDTLTVISPDALAGRVTAGDTAQVAFTSPEPISDVTAAIGGQNVPVTSADGRSWTGSIELGSLTGSGRLDLTVDHTTADGDQAATVHGSTDGTALYGSDESNLVDLADAQVIKEDGSPDATKAAQSTLMLDGNAATFSDVAAVDGEFHLIWDFGEGAEVTVDRADFLARQDNNGLVRMDGQVLQGSNDLQHWTTLTDPTFKTLSWQHLPSQSDEGFRYVRIANNVLIDVAELRLFGAVSYDLDPILARAGAVDLAAHSRGSAILFTREVEAVRAAAAEAGADESALAQRLLDAWSLLEDAATTAAAPLDQAWVTASSASWDGTRNAAANGWAMFDGNTATFTDTTTKNGWVSVIPGDGTAFTVEAVKYHPRSGAVSRANNVSLQGSNDGGATWTTFASTGIAVAGWNTVTLTAPVRYEALRVSGADGYTNFAEVQFLVSAIDKTGLDLYLTEAGALSESDWTADSWTAFATARDAAQTVADDKGATQEEVDEATDALAAATAGLTKP